MKVLFNRKKRQAFFSLHELEGLHPFALVSFFTSLISSCFFSAFVVIGHKFIRLNNMPPIFLSAFMTTLLRAEMLRRGALISNYSGFIAVMKSVRYYFECIFYYEN